ncbi:MAG: MATE family efflux transporter, partial [Lachnospiraceae bacterium]
MRKIGNVDPLKGPILINMIYYSLPVLAANILQMLFSTVDTMVIGRFAQGTAISSIGAVSSAISFLMNGLLSLSGGVTVVLGSLYGKRDRDGIRRIQQSLPLTSLLLGALVGAAACALTVPILKAVHCPEELMKGAATYFRLYFISAPFAITCLSISSSMQAKGESLTPVIFSLAVALLNTVLDLLFVITFGWDIFGVGLATVISQAAGTAAGLIYLSHRSDELHTDLRRLTLFDGMGEVFSIGIPYALEGMILNVSTVVISSFVNRFDPAVIAGGTIAGSVESLAVVFFTSFKSASTVFVSQNRGAGDLDRVLKTWKISLTFVFIATEAAGILIYLA